MREGRQNAKGLVRKRVKHPASRAQRQGGKERIFEAGSGIRHGGGLCARDGRRLKATRTRAIAGNFFDVGQAVAQGAANPHTPQHSGTAKTVQSRARGAQKSLRLAVINQNWALLGHSGSESRNLPGSASGYALRAAKRDLERFCVLFCVLPGTEKKKA